MNSKIIQPKNINLDDLDPRIDWNRPLMAPGHMGVDFETRVDFRRLHKYRLSRAQQALSNSDLSALILFDVNNIRYLAFKII